MGLPLPVHMKKLTIILLIIISIPASAQESSSMKQTLPAPGKFRLELTGEEVRFFLSPPALMLESVLKRDSAWIIARMPDYFPSGSSGHPRLPAKSDFIEWNPSGDDTLEILEMDSLVVDLEQQFPAHRMMPVYPPVQKKEGQITPPDVLIKPYPSDDEWFGEPVLQITKEGTMRGITISRVQFSPLKYNPAKNRIKIYYNVRARLYSEKGVQQVQPEISDRGFEAVLGLVNRQPHPPGLKKVVSSEPVTLVILSDARFKGALQPLIDWKTKKGFRVIEAYTDDPAVGSDRESIKNYLGGLYHDPPEDYLPPAFLMIVGDVEHIPLSQSSGQTTDLYYTTFDGPGDYLPDMFSGRIAVKDSAELSHVVDKILTYEKYDLTDPGYLDRTILIAGYDGTYAATHGNGQINYAADYYFNEDNGVETNLQLHPAASSNDSAILADVSEGAALVNYTGHGEYYGWLNPSFRLDDLESLTNYGKYGLFIGNGCSTNEFDLSVDCFAEVALKAENRGAIAYIGCTNDSYWDEDFYWAVGVGPISANPLYSETTAGYYDKLFHLNDEPVAQWAPSLGEMIFAGNMTVQGSSTSLKKYYWEIYQLMGDPTLIPWFSVPGEPNVQYPAAIPPGSHTLGLQAGPYDYAALSAGDHLLDARHADAFGNVTLYLPDTLQQEFVDLVVTGDTRQPLIDSIPLALPEDAFLEMTDVSLTDESVKPDQKLSHGESASLDLLIRNMGKAGIVEDTLMLRTENDQLVVMDSIIAPFDLPAGDTVHYTKAFSFLVKDSIRNNSEITLSLETKGTNQDNKLFINKTLAAPTLSSVGIRWNDRPYGNGNGIMEAGETILFEWIVRNTGGFSSDSLRLVIREDTFAAYFDNLHVIKNDPLGAGEEGVLKFSARLLPEIPAFADTLAVEYVTDGVYYATDSALFVSGRYFEGFSNGSLTNWQWSQSGTKPWKIDTGNFRHAPSSISSGDISHQQTSGISLDIVVRETDSVVFDYSVSSESGYDFLRFLINGEEMERWSGYRDWQTYRHVLQPGEYTLTWKYTKDVSLSRGNDRAWIDNIHLPGSAFDRRDIALVSASEPVSGAWLSDRETLSFFVQNTGLDTIKTYSVLYGLDGSPLREEFIEEALLPDSGRLFRPDTTFDLTEIGTYPFVFLASAGGDNYPANDTLFWQVEHYLYPDLAITGYALDSTLPGMLKLEAEIENRGNTYRDSLQYWFVLNNTSREKKPLSIDLESGESRLFTIPFLSPADSIGETGWYTYEWNIAGTDSVPADNTISGNFYWITSAEQIVSNRPIKLYPNPAGREVRVTGLQQGKAVRLEIRTLGGILLKKYRWLNSPAEKTLPLELAPGTYVISLRQSGQSRSGILIIQ